VGPPTNCRPGIVGIIAGIFSHHHPSRNRSGCNKPAVGNIETVLASAIARLFFAAFIVAERCGYAQRPPCGVVRYPTRYPVGSGPTSDRKSTVVWPRPSRTVSLQGRGLCRDIPEKLAFFDYVGQTVPAKGGCFRVAPWSNGEACHRLDRQ